MPTATKQTIRVECLACGSVSEMHFSQPAQVQELFEQSVCPICTSDKLRFILPSREFDPADLTSQF